MADMLRARKTRAKTGCLCCRLRRKKCDERMPICTGCDRNKIICSWGPNSPGQEQSSDLGWRNRLESGEPVSRPRKDFTKCKRNSISINGSAISTSADYKQSKTEFPSIPSPASQLRLSEMFSTATLKQPSSRILFEHYINNTSHLLCTIRGPENPFITCVIPLARTDTMIMACVLAISGAHLGCATPGSEIQQASSTYYALALRGFKHTLTKAVSDSNLKPVNLLLTALMLCHVESISGNDKGAIFHHLRASSHFVRLMLGQSLSQVGHELPGFLLETYTYLVSVVNITANTDSDPQTVIFEPFANALNDYKDSNIYGATMGCAQDLLELISPICRFGYVRIVEDRNNECSTETMALYKSLESKIQNWQPPQVNTRDNCSVEDRLKAAKFYQQALLIFLHANFYASKNSDPAFLALVETSLELSVPLVADLSNETPIIATMLWPALIIGSCLRDPLYQMFLRHRMLASPFNMLLISKTVQLLEWLWEENEFGPYGLGNVMKRHKITHCML